MHKIAAYIAWHTLTEVALWQISINSLMFQWELSFVFEGWWTLNICHMQISNLMSVFLITNCVSFFNRPKIQFIKWNFETLNHIYAVTCWVEISSFVTARVGSVLIKLFFACLTCNEDGDLFFCLLFAVWSVWSAGL